MTPLARVCVFAGSNAGVRTEYREAAAALGRMLAERGLALVYGGAHVGLMGAVADAVLQSGGRVTGVIPESLVAKEVAHGGLTELLVVSSMHERKALMSDLADAFIALPGGWGTWEEFFEMLTWAQLGLHRKACGLLNILGYFDPLLSFVDHSIRGLRQTRIPVDDLRGHCAGRAAGSACRLPAARDPKVDRA